MFYTDHTEEYLKIAYEGYVEVDEFPEEIEHRTVIHLYLVVEIS